MGPLLGERDGVDVAGDAPADPPGLGGREAGAAVAQVSVEAPAQVHRVLWTGIIFRH